MSDVEMQWKGETKLRSTDSYIFPIFSNIFVVLEIEKNKKVQEKFLESEKIFKEKWRATEHFFKKNLATTRFFQRKNKGERGNFQRKFLEDCTKKIRKFHEKNFYIKKTIR